MRTATHEYYILMLDWLKIDKCFATVLEAQEERKAVQKREKKNGYKIGNYGIYKVKYSKIFDNDGTLLKLEETTELVKE